MSASSSPGQHPLGSNSSGNRDQWWLVIAAGLAVFMATMDMSIVSVALPVIEHDFGIPTSSTEWVVLGYLLPLVALALPSGRWLGQVGTRSALVFSTVGFAVASAAAAAAPSIAGLTRISTQLVGHKAVRRVGSGGFGFPTREL